MGGVLGWKKMINHLIMTQSKPPYRFLRSPDCPFKVDGIIMKENRKLLIFFTFDQSMIFPKDPSPFFSLDKKPISPIIFI